MSGTRFLRYFANRSAEKMPPFSQEPLVDPQVIQTAVRNRMGRKRLRLFGDALVLVCSVTVAGTILGRAYKLDVRDDPAPPK
jgi:hypothetical protein